MGTMYEEQSGTRTFWVYEADEAEVLDQVSLGMLTNNHIKGIANAQFAQADLKKYVKYDISDHITLEKYLTSKRTRKEILAMLQGMVTALVSTEEYMLNKSSVLLESEQIFVREDSADILMIVLPLVQKEDQVNLCNFFHRLMQKVVADENENLDYIARLMNYLNRHPQFSCVDFQKFLGTLKTQNLEPKPQVKPVLPPRSRQEHYYHGPVSGHYPAPRNQETVPQPRTRVSGDYDIQGERNRNLEQVTIPSEREKTTKKEISWLYLMQHYNKENAAAYKAQKAAKKEQKRIEKEERRKKTFKTTDGEIGNYLYDVPNSPGKDNHNFVSGQGNRKYYTPVVPRHQTGPITDWSGREPLPYVLDTAKDEGTIILDNGETELLDQNGQRKRAPYLIRQKNNEYIAIDTIPFRIGKEGYADYAVEDNNAVSRVHAAIGMNQEDYTITDTNSTNHVYIDDMQIPVMQEIPLLDGNIIRLGNEIFEFRLL